jgi:hypothetical protein
MDPLQPNTGALPPSLRALTLGLLLETVVPMLSRSRSEGRVPSCDGERAADGKAELWKDLRCKCAELSALVARADDPGEAAAYVLGYLPKDFEYVFEHLGNGKRRPGLGGCEPVRQLALPNGAPEFDSA